MATTTVAINLDAKTKGTDSVKSLKAQIREATQEAAAMSQKFGEFSPQAREAAQRVADLKDQMDDLNEKIQALHPDKFNRINTIAKGVANGFQAAQGAMALFGSESEEVQKTLLKVQGAMAFAQGLEGLDGAGKQLKTLGLRGIEAFKGMTTASKVFMLTGIGLVLTAIAALIGYWDDIKGAINGVSAEQAKLNAETQKNLEANKEKLTTLDKSENILKLQGKSEREIRQMKLDQLKLTIANAETNVKNAKITKDAQVEAAKRNKEFLKGILDFVNKPLQLVIDTVTTVANFFGAEWELDLAESMASAIFDPEEVAAEGDKLIKEAEDTLLELKNQQAGLLLSIQKENQEAAAKAQETQKKIAEDRAKADADYAQQTAVTLNERLAAFEKSWALELKGEAKKNLTKEQLEREHALRRQAIIDKVNADREAARKASADKEFADSIKSTDQFFKEEQAKLVGNNEALAQLEVQRLEAQLQNARDYGQSTIDLELQLAQKRKEIGDKQKEDEKRKEEAIQNIRMSGLQGASDVLNAMAGLMKEGSDAQKAFAIAAIAADTAKAISSTIVEARNTARNMTAMGVPAPGPQIAGAAVYASGLAMVLNNAKRARDILRGGSASGGGGGSVGAVGAAPGAMTPLTGGALPEEGQFGGMGRVYVLEGDITKTQTRVRRLRNTSVV